MFKILKKNTTYVILQNIAINNLIFWIEVLVEGLFWFAPTGYSIKVIKLLDIKSDLEKMKQC